MRPEVEELQSRMTQGDFGQRNIETFARILFFQTAVKRNFKFTLLTIGSLYSFLSEARGDCFLLA
jgi:hypothetical protein